MKYILETKTYVTSAGNRMSELEVYFQNLNEMAEDLAWPQAPLLDINGEPPRDSNGLIPTDVQGNWIIEYAHIDNRPKFGEKRTLVALERLIDAASTTTNQKEGV